jgi:WD40 repeat protein
LEFTEKVTGVRIRKEYILVTIVNKAYLYRFSDLELVYSFETVANPHGACAMSYGDATIVAVPGDVVGRVFVRHVNSPVAKSGVQSFQAHENAVAAMAISWDGDKLATVSERGTIVRVWDTKTLALIKELRRGIEPAVITSLSFNRDATQLLVLSSKGTLHVFSLADKNKRSSFVYFSNYLPQYFSSEWSEISFQVCGSAGADLRCKAAFGQDNTIYVVSLDKATFFIYKYNTENSLVECINEFPL